MDDRWAFHKLIRGVDEARQRYSDTTHEVGRLELCLDAVKVVLSASERETDTAQVVTSDA